jgi:WD40 repeat protein
VSSISHVFVFGVQIRTIGHTCEGDCICTRDEIGDLEIDYECPVTGHSREVTSVAYSPDGIRIISGSADNTVKVWDAATGKEVSRRVLPSLYHLLLSALMLTCEVGP